ncbi:MAG: PAS domain-containing protein [Bacteroidetes bacterium]|nr:PAS domain-containing protein [Bacteroidota bacterium]
MTVDIPQNGNLSDIGLHVADQIEAMLSYWDKNLICRYANKAFKHWFGLSQSQMIDKMHLSELLGEVFEKNRTHIEAALAGTRQQFERELLLFNGEVKNVLTTYIPHFEQNKVSGFFVHVADVTKLKTLEKELKYTHQQMLRSVIESQEEERMRIAYILGESVNQTLVYCKMILQMELKKHTENAAESSLIQNVNKAIGELNELNRNLVPSAIEHFGFIKGTADYIDNFTAHTQHEIFFKCTNEAIESIALADKLSFFRIIQNFLQIVKANTRALHINITVQYHAPKISFLLGKSEKSFHFDRSSKEYKDIQIRVEYYGGTLEQIHTSSASILKIAFALPQ